MILFIIMMFSIAISTIYVYDISISRKKFTVRSNVFVILCVVVCLLSFVSLFGFTALPKKHTNYTIKQLEENKTDKTEITDIEKIQVYTDGIENENSPNKCKIKYSTNIINSEIDTDTYHINIQKSKTGKKAIIKYKIKSDISNFDILFTLRFLDNKNDTVYVIYN